MSYRNLKLKISHIKDTYKIINKLIKLLIKPQNILL